MVGTLSLEEDERREGLESKRPAKFMYPPYMNVVYGSTGAVTRRTILLYMEGGWSHIVHRICGERPLANPRSETQVCSFRMLPLGSIVARGRSSSSHDESRVAAVICRLTRG